MERNLSQKVAEDPRFLIAFGMTGIREHHRTLTAADQMPLPTSAATMNIASPILIAMSLRPSK